MQHSELPFLRKREIVLEDTDAAGIVYTPRISNFVVEAVESWFTNRLLIDLKGDGCGMVFASLSSTFLAPMRPPDVLEIRVALSRIGRSSLGFEIVGHRDADDRLCWMAETVCVFIDKDSFGSRLIPTELRDRLEVERALSAKFPFHDRTSAS